MTYRFNTAVIAALTLTVPFIMWPGIYDFTLHPRLFAIQLGLLFCCVGLVASKTESRHPVLLALAAWAAWTVLSTLWATNPVEALIQSSRITTFALLTLIVGVAVQPRSIFVIYACAGMAGGLVAIIGIGQYFGWAFEQIPSVGNPSATFGYRNFAASYLVASIPCAVVFAQTASRKWMRILWSSAGVAMAIFLAYTRTRGAWVSLFGAVVFALGIAVYLYLRKWRLPFRVTAKKLGMIALAITVVIGAAAIQPQMAKTGKFGFDERKTDAVTTLSTAFSPKDARGRLIVWWHTLEMVWDHPFIGVGLGSWQYIYPRYDQGDWITLNATPQRPHNDLLWILSETGIVGFGLFMGLLFTVGQAVLQAIKNRPDHRETLWMIGIAVGIVAFIGHGFFSFPKERAAPAFMFWLGVGSIIQLSQERHTQPTSLRPIFALAIPLLLCSLTLTYRTIRFDKHYLRAHGAWRTQNWQALATETNAALQWGPLNHRAILLNGLAYHQLGDYQSAVAAYRQSQRYQPNDAHGALGSAYRASGQIDSAIASYERELALFPNAANTILALADALKDAGLADRAAQTYRRYLAIETKNLDVWKKWAALESQRGNDALIVYREALKHLPNSAELYLQIGNTHQSNGQWGSAVQAYQKAIARDPQNAVIYNNLGAVQARQQRYAEAEASYQKALALDPNYARAHHNLGDLYAAQKDTARAIAAYQTFINTWHGDARFAQLAKEKIRRLSP